MPALIALAAVEAAMGYYLPFSVWAVAMTATMVGLTSILGPEVLSVLLGRLLIVPTVSRIILARYIGAMLMWTLMSTLLSALSSPAAPAPEFRLPSVRALFFRHLPPSGYL